MIIEIDERQTARLTRCMYVQAVYRRKGVTRAEALDLLSRPLTPGDESTRSDDRDLLDKSTEDVVAALFQGLADDYSPVLPTD